MDFQKETDANELMDSQKIDASQADGFLEDS